MIARLFLLCFLASQLHGGIYLEKPDDFNPKYSIVGCCYLHYQDKILLLHRRDNKAEGNRWGIPGGKIHKGEPLLEAVIREVAEETGYSLDPEYVEKIIKNQPPRNHRESAIWRFRLIANSIIIKNQPPMINQNRPLGGFVSLPMA